MQITDYIKPELLAVALVLYFVGIGLKHSQTIQNQYVPGVLGILGILLAGLYVFATTEFQTDRRSQWQFLRRSCRESLWRD